jgi:hypothetical protein
MKLNGAKERTRETRMENPYRYMITEQKVGAYSERSHGWLVNRAMISKKYMQKK